MKSMSDLKNRIIYVRPMSPPPRLYFCSAHKPGRFLLPREYHESSACTFVSCHPLPITELCHVVEVFA